MVKPKSLMEKVITRYEALPDSWFQNELFEQTKDYLARGRRHETMKVDRLNEEWADAFRQFVKLPVGPCIQGMADAGAELRLRGYGFPTHLVPQEVAQLQTSIRCAVPLAPSADFDPLYGETVEGETDTVN